MKNRLLILSLAVATSWCAARTPEAWDDISVSGSVGYCSEYVFRGYYQTSGALQGSVEIGYPFYQGDIYVGVWSNQPIANPDQTSEIDGHIGYVIPIFKQLHIDFGHIYYWYPEDNRNVSIPNQPPGFLRGLNRSNESYVGLWGDTAELFDGIRINPSLYYYYDWNCDKHTIELSLYHEWDLSDLINIKGLVLIPKIYAGYQTAARPFGDTGLAKDIFFRASGAYFGADLTLTYRINENVRLYASGFWAGNRDTSAHPYRKHDQFIGASFGVKFGL